MSQAAILALFTTLSQEERLETVQSLCALLACPSGVAAPSEVAPAKKTVKASAKASAAPPKEKVSRGPNDWTQYVMRVRAETGLKMAEAMAEAKRRREAGDPDAPPAAATKKAPSSASAAAPKPKTVAAPKKAAPAPAPVVVEEEESAGVELAPSHGEGAIADSSAVELEEVEVEGQDYLYLPAHENAAWLKEADGSRGAWAGYLNTETGDFDMSRPAPELADE